MSNRSNNHFEHENFDSLPSGSDGQNFFDHMRKNPLLWAAVGLLGLGALAYVFG